MTIFKVVYTQRTSPQIHSDCVLCRSSDLDDVAVRDILAALIRKTGLPVSDIHISGVDRLNDVLEVPVDVQANQSDPVDPVPTPGPAPTRAAGGESPAKPEPGGRGAGAQQSGANRRASGR